MSDCQELRSFGNCQRLCVLVVGLPIEVVARDSQNHFFPTIGIGQTVFPTLPTEMRMREERDDVCVLRKFDLRIDAVIVRSGWYDKLSVYESSALDLLFRCLFGKNETHRRLILFHFS